MIRQEGALSQARHSERLARSLRTACFKLRAEAHTASACWITGQVAGFLREAERELLILLTPFL
jgi:hypothetical protein